MEQSTTKQVEVKSGQSQTPEAPMPDLPDDYTSTTTSIAELLQQKSELEQRLADLTTENSGLNAQVAAFQTRDAEAKALECQIAEKMQHGLNRQQAIAVIQRQREYDASKKQASRS